MNIELESNGPPMTNPNDLVLANLSQYLIGLGVDEQSIDGDVISTRKEAMEARLPRHHMVFFTHRGAALADLLAGRRTRCGSPAPAKSDTKYSAQLVGILDRHRNITPLSKQNENRQQQEASGNRETGGTKPTVVCETFGQGQELRLH
jgi:hypothetical protein